jgi:hypothetical protein
MFRALCARRNIGIKYRRYEAGMVASAVYNSRRTSDEQAVVTAFDFVRDETSSIERDNLRRVQATIRQVIGSLPASTTREKLLEIRQRVISSMVSQGRTDAAEIFDAVWPSLKPASNQ